MAVKNSNKSKIKISGMTIVEAIFAIFLVLIVGIAIWTFQKDVFFFGNVLESSLDASKEARKAIKTITDEVRSASLGSNGAYPIEEASQNSFIFFSNIDGDNLKEKIHYFLSGKVLKKTVTKPTGNPPTYNSSNEITEEVAHFIDNGAVPLLSYYDNSYDGTSSPLNLPADISAIRLVKITIIIDKDVSRSPEPLRVESQVTLRNLKDNT